ncbi:hypothetical protein LEP1GSC202_3822 [Leptospira yanagawae serovar Saopaulo str. Sao Paulo = ATCC 700523]|uniref:Uncharacterized protein n=1 Tax=Leptospira yanagawae serovar Saopaulo str. Sao Paulo = ATCC 700523 TaxID=1249483 RepID=A0A5E8HIC6_9LEPT|nr:hypothetical protein LEP1GSC202_3822 [Leptospira yanagawae serovar Saopaulo str. Sao Paulo = ATCC 700523]
MVCRQIKILIDKVLPSAVTKQTLDGYCDFFQISSKSTF